PQQRPDTGKGEALLRGASPSSGFTFAHGLLEFSQFHPGLRTHDSWHLDLYGYILIAVYRRIFHGDNPFSLQPDLSSGLGSLRDPAHYVSLKSRHSRFSAEYSRCKRYLCSGIDIHALPFKSFFRLDLYFKKQIPGRSSAVSRRAFAFQADAFAVVDPGRHMNLKGLRPAAVLRIRNPDGLLTSKGRLLEADRNL